jgi:methenyltetrahydrofolate cyclohydrolase
VPAGGSAAAAAVAMAAGLVEKVARLSTPQMIGAANIRKRAANVRSVAAAYIESDAYAYVKYMEALRAARGKNAAERERILRPAFGGIISEPLKTARFAAEVAEMGAELALHAKPAARSDAVVAVHLAAAAAQASAATLAANLAATPDDARLVEARDLAATASASARRLSARARPGDRGRGRARSGGSARR